jgi:hypothetical protein
MVPWVVCVCVCVCVLVLIAKSNELSVYDYRGIPDGLWTKSIDYIYTVY